MPDDLEAILRRAGEHPDDLAAQIAAAYACDRAGDELHAVTFYDRAWHILEADPGATANAELMLGYGSTLKNVGRLVDSERVLRAALERFPNDRALRLFLALTLERAGRSRAALAEALDVALSLSPSAPDIARYARALREYADELLDGDRTA